MKADTLTLTNLFNKPVTYIVPLFQRPYVWNREEHWEPLWDDLRTVAENLITARSVASEEDTSQGTPEALTPSHFLGAIVVEQLPFGAGMIEQRNIIDGQQRLTTLQLFLDAAADVAAEAGDGSTKLFGKLTDNDPDLIRSSIDRFKVWPTNIDQAVFGTTMKKEERGSDDLANLSQSSIFQAHTYFASAIREWLSESPDTSVTERLDALRIVLWQLLRLVVIDLEPNDNAQVIFETLNARGTPLLASDLIKNSLFRLASERRLPMGDLYESHWRSLDTDWWRESIAQGRLTRPRLDVFFFHWLTMRRGRELGLHELFPQFRRFAAETNDPEGILKDIDHHAKTYRGFDLHPPGSPEETFFYRLRMTETATANPLLLFVLGHPEAEVSGEQRTRLTRAVESWLIRRIVCRMTTKNYNVVFLSLLGEVAKDPARAGDVTVEFLARLEGESQVWPSDEQVRDALLSLPIYKVVSRGRLRMILEALEDSLRSPGKSEEAHVPRVLTIEHVLPQSWEPHWPLPADVNVVEATANRDNLKHSLGNLTLVTHKLNPTLSNAAWVQKRETLGDHTVLFLNKDLVNEYAGSWNESTILERGQQLAARFLSLWPGPTDPFWNSLGVDGLSFQAPPEAEEEVGEAEEGLSSNSTPPTSHVALRAYAATEFVRDAVDGIEEWLMEAGLEVIHNARSHHSFYAGKRWLGGYYFAKKWVHFWLIGRHPADSTLEELSDPSSARFRTTRVAGNIHDESDLELFKQGVLARVAQGPID